LKPRIVVAARAVALGALVVIEVTETDEPRDHAAAAIAACMRVVRSPAAKTPAIDLCRPPIAQERLEETAGGKLRDTLMRPWREGTIAIVLEAATTPDAIRLLVKHGLRPPPPRRAPTRQLRLVFSEA
jgi:hypothetical protein